MQILIYRFLKTCFFYRQNLQLFSNFVFSNAAHLAIAHCHLPVARYDYGRTFKRGLPAEFSRLPRVPERRVRRRNGDSIFGHGHNCARTLVAVDFRANVRSVPASVRRSAARVSSTRFLGNNPSYCVRALCTRRAKVECTVRDDHSV